MTTGPNGVRNLWHSLSSLVPTILLGSLTWEFQPLKIICHITAKCMSLLLIVTRVALLLRTETRILHVPAIHLSRPKTYLFSGCTLPHIVSNVLTFLPFVHELSGHKYVLRNYSSSADISWYLFVPQCWFLVAHDSVLLQYMNNSIFAAGVNFQIWSL